MKIRQLFVTTLLLSFVLGSHDGAVPAISHAKSAHADLSYLQSLRQYTTGFGQGLYDYGVEAFRCIKLLVLHPIASLHSFVDAIYHYEETYLLVKTAVDEVLAAYPNYSIAQKARIQAIVFAETISIFTPTTLPSAWTKHVMTRVRKVPAFKRFDPVCAAEWFASEGR